MARGLGFLLGSVGGGGGAGATLTAAYVGYGDSSNILTGTSNLQWDQTNKYLHIDGGNALGSKLQFTSGTQSGTSTTDGFTIGPDDGSNDITMTQNEGSSAVYIYNSAAAVYRYQQTSSSTSIVSPDGNVAVRSRNAGVGISTNSPDAVLTLKAGTTSSSSAPLKFLSGSLMTASESGAAEYNGSYYLTKGGGSVRFSVGGCISENFADAGSTGTSETDLYSYTIPGFCLDVNGHKIEAKYAGIFVNSTSTKELKVKFAGTTIFDSGALTISASSSWELEILLIRVSSTVIRCTVKLNTSGASLSAYCTYTELTSQVLTSGNILKITGTAAGVGAADNDIVAKLGNVEFKAHVIA